MLMLNQVKRKPATMCGEPQKTRQKHGKLLLRKVCMSSVDVSGDGGVLVKWTKREESGEVPRDGDTLLVRYVGSIEKTGYEFDRTHGGYSFEFQLGLGKVVRGFELGVAKMRIGEAASITVRGDYGYGDEGSGDDIPKNATLLFQVELVGIKERTKGHGDSDRERLALLREDREAAALALKAKKEAQAAKAESAKAALSAKLANKNSKGSKKKGKK